MRRLPDLAVFVGVLCLAAAIGEGRHESAKARERHDPLLWQLQVFNQSGALLRSQEVVGKENQTLALADPISNREIETAIAASAPVILSPLDHCYLDTPYAEPSADAMQMDRQSRVGLRRYVPKTVAESFEWEPAQVLGARRAGHVAGVEAAIWTETIDDFDDLSFSLLPRLPGIAHKAWSDPKSADWRHHRASLARHARLWEQDDLTYFRTSAVDWL